MMLTRGRVGRPLLICKGAEQQIELMLEKPNLEKVLAYNRQFKVGFIKKKKFYYFKMSDSIERFQIFGHGPYFYFYFLKVMCLYYLVASLLSAPQVFINLNSNGFHSSQTDFIFRTTLGNFLQHDQTIFGYPQKTVLRAFVILDVFNIAVFLLFNIFINFSIFYKFKKIENKDKNIQMLTLQVGGASKSETRESVREFFG